MGCASPFFTVARFFLLHTMTAAVASAMATAAESKTRHSLVHWGLRSCIPIHLFSFKHDLCGHHGCPAPQSWLAQLSEPGLGFCHASLQLSQPGPMPSKPWGLGSQNTIIPPDGCTVACKTLPPAANPTDNPTTPAVVSLLLPLLSGPAGPGSPVMPGSACCMGTPWEGKGALAGKAARGSRCWLRAGDCQGTA